MARDPCLRDLGGGHVTFPCIYLPVQFPLSLFPVTSIYSSLCLAHSQIQALGGPDFAIRYRRWLLYFCYNSLVTVIPHPPHHGTKILKASLETKIILEKNEYFSKTLLYLFSFCHKNFYLSSLCLGVEKQQIIVTVSWRTHIFDNCYGILYKGPRSFSAALIS